MERIGYHQIVPEGLRHRIGEGVGDLLAKLVPFRIDWDMGPAEDEGDSLASPLEPVTDWPQRPAVVIDFPTRYDGSEIA